MVTVKITPNKLIVTGHAMSGEPGQDLICNSVSVLVQALEIGINPKFLEVVKKEPGDLEYKIYTPGNKAMMYAVMCNLKMITDSLKVLADENPEHVKVVIE